MTTSQTAKYAVQRFPSDPGETSETSMLHLNGIDKHLNHGVKIPFFHCNRSSISTTTTTTTATTTVADVADVADVTSIELSPPRVLKETPTQGKTDPFGPPKKKEH